MVKSTTRRAAARILLCSGLTLCLFGCQGLVEGGGPASSNPRNLQTIQHIIVMVQENRSFDTYFGRLGQYWSTNGFPSASFDGIPANASNPSADGTTTVSAYHLATVCTQNTSPSWNESHVVWNRNDPVSSTATLDGYVLTASNYAKQAPASEQPIYDTAGIRAMGYYEGSDLNYYYFMASNFATSDRWFSPLMARTQPNRLFLYAATSAGHVYEPTTTLSNKTIFELLDAAGVSWKIYETDPGSNFLTFFQPYATQHAANIVPVSQYLTDVQNGTLPAVAFIEGGYNSGRDEHPNNNIQTGAAYVASLINALMNSPSWQNSVFILTYDEGGGLYDHVAPQPAVSPDGIKPLDLQTGDICTTSTGPNCDFTFTGYRVPLLVVGPYVKKHYVSHAVADYTAILKLIETRFQLPSLTKRDAAQMDMSEFFDSSGPWLKPPTPPAQATNGNCNVQTLK